MNKDYTQLVEEIVEALLTELDQSKLNKYVLNVKDPLKPVAKAIDMRWKMEKGNNPERTIALAQTAGALGATADKFSPYDRDAISNLAKKYAQDLGYTDGFPSATRPRNTRVVKVESEKASGEFTMPVSVLKALKK